MSLRLTTLGIVALLLAACAGAPSSGTAPTPAASAPGPLADDSAGMVPPGYGTLRTDDIDVELTLPRGVVVRLLPLDEAVIRLLSPDAYRTTHELVQGKRAALAEVARRSGSDRVSVWRITYFGTEQGEVRFSPQEVIVTTGGRDYRPLDVVPLTPGFGEQRLRQRDRQDALLLFDGTLDVNQPHLVTSVEGVMSDAWGGSGGPLEKLDRERVLVRSRASRSPTTARP